MHSTISEFMRTHHPCLLLVHLETSRLVDICNELLSVYDWEHLSVGQELSKALFPEAPQRRSRVARHWMRSYLRSMGNSPVLCTEIELLFEPSLEIDPLSLLSDAGRLVRLVVAWPGSFQDNVLAYAVPEHSHYRTWRKPGVSIATID
jgi:hypothetical protein